MWFIAQRSNLSDLPSVAASATQTPHHMNRLQDSLQCIWW